MRWTLVAMLASTVVALGAEPAKGPKIRDDELAAARRDLLGAIPATEPGAYETRRNAAGEYLYEATSARPVVDGGRCALESNKVVQGLTVVRLESCAGDPTPDEVRNTQVYWRLGEIERGSYWIGVWYQSGDAKNEASQPRDITVPVYLNGRMVQLGTHSDPVQVAPGVFFAEAQAAEAVALQPGDEIAVGRKNGGLVARVVLRQRAPERGPHRMPTDFGGHQWNPYTALGVNVDAVFTGPAGEPFSRPSDSIERQARDRAAVVDSNGLGRVDFILCNPLPVPVTVACTNVVRGYYHEVVARDEALVTIPAHGRVVRTVRYRWAEGEPAYVAFMNLRAVNPPPLATPRDRGGLGWPEHEVYSYFPGQRHVLPWPDPYAYRNLRRLTLAKTDLGLRDTLSLNGWGSWERAYTSDLVPPMPPPAGLEFKPVGVPYREDITGVKPRPHGVYLRRVFTLPVALTGRSYRLALDKVQDEATAYVNGQKVGNVRGANTPLYCDITRAVRPGSNEVIVVVRDMIAIMNPAYVNTNAPEANADYLDAPGLFGANTLALFGADVESGPAVSTEEAFAITSVRKQTMGARLTVGNRTAAPLRVRVKASVLDEGRPVLTVGERELTLAPDVPQTIDMETAWPNPRLWGPVDPHLYALAVEVTDAATGQRLDWRRERFGFRESWIDGPHIMFNGFPIRPNGAGLITRLSPDGDFRFTRGAAGDRHDEAGLLGYHMTTMLCNTMSQHNAERREFWETAARNALVAMKSWQNHPSVQAWDISNEWLCFAMHVVNDITVPARNFKSVSDALRAQDPTRWTLANADGDLWGLLDNQSFHYMEPYRAPGGTDMRGHTAYLPDGEFWRPLERHFRPGEAFPMNSFHTYFKLNRDKKVIMDNEYLWKVGSLMPPGPTAWIGEDDVLSPAMDDASGPMAWLWKTKIDGHRDLGVAMANIYTYHAGVQRGAYLEQTFIMPENQRRGFAGRTETRRYTLLNGRFYTADMRLSWDLRRPDGKAVQQGRVIKRMPSGGHEVGEIAFRLPKVRRPTVHTLGATLEADGKFVSREEWDIEVWPDEPVPAGELARKVMLFEPGAPGSTARALTAAGVPFERITDLSSLAASGLPRATLIVAENALNATNVAVTGSLTNFVDRGGRVLVLRQGVAPRNLPVRTALEPGQWASQVFVRMGDHPIFSAPPPSTINHQPLTISSMDLHFWQSDRAVAQGVYTKPGSGNFITLADSGGPDGMESACLMELYRGQGAYVLCQVPVVGRYDVEPMARELLARLVRYTGGANLYAAPTQSLTVVAAGSGAVVQRLQGLGAAYALVSTNRTWQGDSPALIDAAAGRAAAPADRVQWAAALRGGATVVITGAESGDHAWLSELAGVPVKLTVPPYRMWDGRGFRRGWSRWTAGLSHLDLYWKRYDGGEMAWHQSEDPSYMIEPLQDHTVRAEGGTEHVFPGALVEVPVGKGRLLLDQRRWWTVHEALARHSGRTLSALLIGLNVGMAPVEPPPELRGEVVYRPVDLTPFANRGLADEVAQDGVGGWSDQGPRCDLRGFPTGLQLFQGVPFAIGQEPKVCIVLASRSRAGSDVMPKEVAIPLGYAVEGLYLLHGTAFSGGLVGGYTMEYADGQTVEVSLVVGENIQDWAGPTPLPREKGTQSVIAWTGRNLVFPRVGVYRMLWVNPRPDVPLKRLVFSNPRLAAVLGLFGVTAAVSRNSLKPATDRTANAQALFEKGRAAAGENRLEEALRLLRQSLAADPTLGDAYRALLDTAERTHDESQIMAAAWQWGLSGPPAPAPWNRFGALLEKRGDLRGALEAYRKSLVVEWNQPPIMEARRRLEQQEATRKD
jgi:beta-galactosidase